MPKPSRKQASKILPIRAEFAAARLGDKRRTARLQQIAEAFSESPSQSLRTIAGSSAALEAIYRFNNNDRFDGSVANLLQSHAEASAVRARACKTVLAIHDATDLTYPFDGELREGFGRLGNQQGIQALVSLAVSFSETSESLTRNDDHDPIGVVGCQTWAGARTKPEKKKLPKRPPKAKGTRWGRISGEEWHSSIAETRRVLGADARLIHVIDREADGNELLWTLKEERESFVIRIMRCRRVVFAETPDEYSKITDSAVQLPRIFEEQIHIGKRGYLSNNQRHPPRSARLARLTYAAGPVRLKRTPQQETAQSLSEPFLDLNLVHVKERDTPPGEEPIEWFLVTTEPIATEFDVRRVVRLYRARWLVEELFRVLKVGCAIEKRQVESRRSLEAVLAVSLVVSWRILRLRHLSRTDATAPAGVAFSKVEIDLLQKMRGLPTTATVQDALLTVAQLGGHLKHNGPPGNVVLARGLEKLEAQAEVWEFAMARSDR